MTVAEQLKRDERIYGFCYYMKDEKGDIVRLDPASVVKREPLHHKGILESSKVFYAGKNSADSYTESSDDCFPTLEEYQQSRDDKKMERLFFVAMGLAVATLLAIVLVLIASTIN
jgi:hypothetical protein